MMFRQAAYAVCIGAFGAALALDSAEAYVLRGGSPGKWGSPVIGTGASLTWSLMGAGLATDLGLTVDPAGILPAGYFGVIEAAFDAWAAVADLSFAQALDPGVGWLDPAAYAVDIRIGFRPSDGPSDNIGFGYYPLSSNGAGAGDIFLDSDETWTFGIGSGFGLGRVLLHEIGHALGLEHSYEGTAMGDRYSSAWGAPQPDDIAGMRYLYGAPRIVQEPTDPSDPAPGAPSAVPVPATLPMMLGALALLGLVRRRWAGGA
jgi:Matrixin